MGKFDGLFFREASRVAQGLINIVERQIRIGFDDGFFCFPGSQKPQESRDGEAQVSDAGLTGTDSRIVRDSGESHKASVHSLTGCPVSRNRR